MNTDRVTNDRDNGFIKHVLGVIELHCMINYMSCDHTPMPPFNKLQQNLADVMIDLSLPYFKSTVVGVCRLGKRTAWQKSGR